MKKGPSPIQVARRERRARNGELIEARQTNRGTGLFALVDLAPKELICGLTGDEERIQTTPAEFDALVEARPVINDYGAEGPRGTMLLPADVNAVGWHLANHSCKPNAKLVTDFGDGLRAVRRIHAGEEITCWYGWSRREVRCLCGERNCTGWIGLPRRRAPDGTVEYQSEDLYALVRSAASVDNDQGVHTVLKTLNRLGKDEDYLQKFLKDVLGPIEGQRIIDKTSR